MITLYAVVLSGLAIGAGDLFYEARQEYNKLKQDEARAQVRLAEAQARLEEQKVILERLKTDRDYVEKVLRRELNYAKPGEVIFLFPK
jgi:cell division protein FtsB